MSQSEREFFDFCQREFEKDPAYHEWHEQMSHEWWRQQDEEVQQNVENLPEMQG